jgi:hypothetical protein
MNSTLDLKTVLSTIVSKAVEFSSNRSWLNRSRFHEPKLRSRIGIGAFVADQFGRGDIGLRRRQMNKFDSNRAIHGEMINYVVLGKNDKLLKSVQDGTIIALLVRYPFHIGNGGVKTAPAAAKGEQVPAAIAIGTSVITKANMNSARSQSEDPLSAMTTNSIRTTGKCSNGGGISSVPFRPSCGAFIFALVALLAAARSNLAAAEDHGAIPIRARTACMVGHQFEPGPIVGGHNRQPTVREFQARSARLRELEQRDADRCAGAPADVERCAGESARTGTC